MVYEFLIQTGIALGNEKSQLLLDVEKQVWRMLFQMVEGRDLDSLLLELVKGISWDALAAAPASDRRWFSLSQTSSQMATSSLHQMTSSPALPFPQQSASLTPSPAPPLPPQTLITQERAQSDMDLGPDSGNPERSSSQLFLPTASTLSPQAEGEEPMDLGPDSGNPERSSSQLSLPTASTLLPQAEEEEPMDTRSDGEAINGYPAPEPDYEDESIVSLGDDEAPVDFGTDLPDFRWTRGNAGKHGEDQHSEEGSTGGREDLDEDKVEDRREDELGEEDEQEQQSSGDEEMALPAGSQPNTMVKPTSTSPRLDKKRPPTSPPKNATKKKKRRHATKDEKKPMPSIGPLREMALGRLLAAGESYTMPIDVEAVDKLMQNFPITEEHQVRSAGVDSLKLYIITFRENRFSQKTFPCQV